MERIEALGSQVVLWGSLVKFSHTVFALPFALSMCLVVAQTHVVTVAQLLWVLLALVAARTAAMAFNRLIDWRIDSLNPRTSEREIPRGAISITSVAILLLISSGVFLFSSAMLGSHCLVLAPFVLVWLLFYSYTKRFTRYSHLVLGVALALAPGGVWYAFTAQFAWLPVLMMLGVALWVSGFDILYSCQDVEFDRCQNLHSIPATLGIEKSLSLAKVLHGLSVISLAIFGLGAGLGLIYFLGLSVFALVLASQHFLVSANDLSKINAAFFTRNGLASVLYFLVIALDIYF